MTKLVFHLFLLGKTTLVISRPSHAQSFNTMNGLIGPKTELSVKAGIESNDQVALASFCESAPDCDNRGQRLSNSCGKGSGNCCGVTGQPAHPFTLAQTLSGRGTRWDMGNKARPWSQSIL